MKIYSRQDWGARPPKWTTPINRSEGMFLHYNGPPVPANVAGGDLQAVFGWLRNIQAYHMNVQGWPDIAYSFCVASTNGGRDAAVIELRGWGAAGAHTLGWNEKSHAIVFPVGGDQPITDAQVEAANNVIAVHDKRFGQGFVRGHQQAPNSTSCPGGPIMNMLRAGRFRPITPAPPVPLPPEVNPMGQKMIKIGAHVWLFFPDQPWRVRVRTPDAVQQFRFLGVPYSEMSEAQGRLFIEHTRAVKTG